MKALQRCKPEKHTVKGLQRAGFAHMASLVVQWTHVLHEDSDVHQDPSLPANVDETYFLQVIS